MSAHPDWLHAFLWPDRTIGKGESRVIREKHNELYNSHAELRTQLQRAIVALNTAPMFNIPSLSANSYQIVAECERMLAKAGGAK